MVAPENPYSPPEEESSGAHLRRWGLVVGTVCFLVCCLPTAFILWELAEMWRSLLAAPSQSVRPVGLVIRGLTWSGVNVLVGLPLAYGCAKWADALGSKTGADIAVWSVIMCALPFLLSLFAPFIIVPATGSAFGT